MAEVTGSVDGSPFEEPIHIDIKYQGAGIAVKCSLRINYRWDTKCEWLESIRVFGHKGQLSDEEMQKELLTAIADMHEKRLWVFKANHGLLDKDDLIIRFKK